ncbi:MAG: PBP1A family penicillin-binding protein [Thermoanaerobaculia bacterium]|nr:PBP1A family penicillin-binding protein [Thermoanaerobaculia bacterium]
MTYSAAAAAKSLAPPPPPPRDFRRRGLRFLLAALVVALLGGAAGVAVAAAIHVPNLDAYVDARPGLVTKLLDRGGAPFATYASERRQMIEEGSLPPLLQNAVLAAEDAEFFRHGGIDLVGIVRTAVTNVLHGRRWGASTITMQLARTLMGRREKTWDRKIAETFLAVELEKRLSKQQVLTLYCNLAFLGHGNYGMEAAARDYFGHGVADLSLVEAATLAGILQRPSDYSPRRNPDKAAARRNYVLRRMLEEGFISRPDHDAAVDEPVRLAQSPPQREVAPYFAEEVRQQLERDFGSERLYRDGLLVETTLDPTIQAAAELALRDGLTRLDRRRGWRGPLHRGLTNLADGEAIERLAGRNPDPARWVPGLVLSSNAGEARVRTPDGELRLAAEGVAWTGRQRVSEILRGGDLAWFALEAPKEGAAPVWTVQQEPQTEGAALVLESATGAVRALVGGWDFQRSKFDRATQASRQVGSAFKPFVFGAAFEAGFTPADTLFDAPAVFAGADGLPSYSPRNYYRRYYGILPLRRALELSVNVSSVKLLDLVGVERVLDFARRCGIRSSLPPYPSLALGSADLLPIEVAAAYAAIANQGVAVQPHFVAAIRRRDGALLSRHQLQASKAMDAAVAYQLIHVLEGVVDRGTAGSIAGLPAALAGKTGTTNDYTDAWFAGFTTRHTILTWVGYDQKKSLGRRMTGAEAALPIWRQIAESGLRDGWIAGDERFPVPAGVELRAIEPHSGLAAVPGTPRVLEEAFQLGTAPTRTWEPRWEAILALPWSQQAAFYEPRPGERMPDATAVALAEQIAAAENDD